jgi:hypothetical protein
LKADEQGRIIFFEDACASVTSGSKKAHEEKPAKLAKGLIDDEAISNDGAPNPFVFYKYF